MTVLRVPSAVYPLFIPTLTSIPESSVYLSSLVGLSSSIICWDHPRRRRFRRKGLLFFIPMRRLSFLGATWVSRRRTPKTYRALNVARGASKRYSNPYYKTALRDPLTRHGWQVPPVKIYFELHSLVTLRSQQVADCYKLSIPFLSFVAFKALFQRAQGPHSPKPSGLDHRSPSYTEHALRGFLVRHRARAESRCHRGDQLSKPWPSVLSGRRMLPTWT